MNRNDANQSDDYSIFRRTGTSRGLFRWPRVYRLLLLLVLQACATPTDLIRREAAALGFEAMELEGNAYRLSAFHRPGDKDRRTLHVYLEGDGHPWASRYRIAQDPTPDNPIMLRLMALDPGPALYLGRPCYLGHAEDPGCSPLSWTHRRYAPEIIDALAAALGRFMAKRAYREPVFMGHSGGGALALLLAERFPATPAAVTLGANLDTEAWTLHHGFSALQGSLNPASAGNSGYREFHYYGDRDRITPMELFRPALAKRPHARAMVIQGYDHYCCWERIWPNLLRTLP